MPTTVDSGRCSTEAASLVGTEARGTSADPVVSAPRRRGVWPFLALLVWALALFHFADNSADPDLWGHVLFGRRLLESGRIEKADPFSWTAPGHAWINHEVLAEAALGAAWRLLGGPGILLLKTAIGLLTFGLGLRLGASRLQGEWKAAAWVIGAAACVEISFGFAPRPQVFSALGLVIEFWVLRSAFERDWRWVLLLPPLFVLWVNTHGGVLAGVLVAGIAVAAETAAVLYRGWKRGVRDRRLAPLAAMGTAVGAGALGLALNPWGTTLPRWLVESVLWVRPEIQEWNPTPLSWAHAPFFCLLGLTIFALVASRRPRAAWETVVLVVLAVMAARHVRHTPLFSLAVLAFVPVHVADALGRYRSQVAGFEALLHAGAPIRRLAAVICAATAVLVLFLTFVLHKQNPFTIEAPRNEYPTAAVRFMGSRGLKGRLLVFFDWGELCLWHLPDCPVSVDGRLDTCYPRTVIRANWAVYNGKLPNPSVLDLRKADLALLPSNLAGVALLRDRLGWRTAYRDPLATVLVRDGWTQPATVGGPDAVAGRSPFP